MTATPTPRPLFDSSDSLLRFALRVDAALCASTGLLVAVIADPLARLSGLSATYEWSAGAALAVYGGSLHVLAAASGLRRIGIAIAVANVLVAVVALAALGAGALPLTGVGVVMSLTAVVMLLGCATAQYLGVRRLA